MKKILIVSYYLGTNKGVGGKRWFNYANYLSAQGYEITILTTSLRAEIERLHPKINIVNFTSNYPKILDHTTFNVFEKVKYRVLLIFMYLVCKGVIFDRAKRLESLIHQEIEKLISSGDFRNLIVSGAPFSLMYFVCKYFRNRINIISDFRDPWTWGHGYGFKNLSKKRKQYEISCEEFVINNSNYVTCASKDISLELNLRMKSSKKKSIVLLNTIDSYKLQNSKTANSSVNKKIIISHIGTIAVDTEKYWKHFLTLIKQSNQEIQLNLYGNNNVQFYNYVKENNSMHINFIKRLDDIKLSKELINSDMLILFKMDIFPNTFPTKFFDYLKSEKPIIAFTEKGEFSNEIERNNLGVIFNDDTDISEFDSFLSSYKKINYSNYDFSKFSIVNQTKILTKILH